MHQPWAHSEQLSEAREGSFGSVHLSESVRKSLSELSDLELIASEHDIPIVEPFTGVGTSDNSFFVIGPDQAYYEELLAEIPGYIQQSATQVFLRKLAEAAQKLVPESLHIETLTDSGETTAQNNTSVISVLAFDRRSASHRRCWHALARARTEST